MSSSPQRLLVMGPPGAGKGTQVIRLASRLAVPGISTGDLFREQVRLATPLGIRISDVLAAGEYVSDDLTNEVIGERLGRPDARRGFILDGYPRTRPQAHYLRNLLAAGAVALDAVVVLRADAATLVERLLGRAVEQGRADDTAEVLARRLQVFAAETAELAGVYAEAVPVHEVDGVGDPSHIANRIMTALGLTG